LVKVATAINATKFKENDDIIEDRIILNKGKDNEMTMSFGSILEVLEGKPRLRPLYDLSAYSTDGEYDS